MSVGRIRQLLREAASDEVIGLHEVQALIDDATDDQVVTHGELLLLQAALQAHRARFTDEAYAALEGFLNGHAD